MPPTETTPATDSAKELRPILGDDSTATFEDDPNFVESNPTGTASSENLEEQRSAAASNVPSARDTDDTEEDEDDEDEEDDEDLDDEDDDDEDDEEYEDDDEDDLDDESEEDDDEDDDEDLDDEDEDDDADEVTASSVLRADGLLGYEDEAEDVKNGVSRRKGDQDRAKSEEKLKDGEKDFDPYSHEDGKWLPEERDNIPGTAGRLEEGTSDSPNFVPPYRAAGPAGSTGVSSGF